MRQFISSRPADRKGLICVDGKDYRYLRQVLRLRSGDMLSVRLPDGSLQNTTVCEINEENRIITLQICADTKNGSITRGVQAGEIESEMEYTGIEYWLFQYIAKPVKMEQIVRQATECGIRFIVPVAGSYSQKQNVMALQSGKKERIERIIREARQQSGSPVKTELLDPVTTEEAVALWKNVCTEKSSAVVLWERNENTRRLKEILTSETVRVAVAVGCEGGISPDEVEVLVQGGFVPVHFAGNILRCETAAVYGIAAVQSMLGEM
ncbi:MAG: 16S rRNA (uracil(1498)-N(3))-methyltransferase [Treponema sp.]|nr:16S rRNA (uracil(1498)-N(3))-methyltransferase [Treponema sp.]